MREQKNEQKTRKGLVVTAPTPTTDLVKTWQLHIQMQHTAYFSLIRRCTEKLFGFCTFFMGRTFDLFTFFSLRDDLSHVKIVTTHVAVRVIVKVFSSL
jgi:hypothetical protein